MENRPQLDPHPLSEYVAWAGQRNREAILERFHQLLPFSDGNVLEFASGSGMHVNFFAPHFRHLHFQPSDRDESVFDYIRKLRDQEGNANIHDPVHLDLTQPESWPKDQRFDAAYCINIFQVAPVSVADGMMQCAAEVLRKGGKLMIYGPFRAHGRFTTPSNEEFDTTLRSYGVPEWGLKDIDDLTAAAVRFGMELREQIDMPANNFLLIFGRA